MRRCTRQAWWLLGLFALSTVSACSSDDDVAPGPTAEELRQVSEVADGAATASGPLVWGGGGGDGQQMSRVDLGLSRGTYAAFAACTGGGSLSMDLSGTAVVLDCDGQGHRVGDLALSTDTVTMAVTQPSAVPSVWAVSITSK